MQTQVVWPLAIILFVAWVILEKVINLITIIRGRQPFNQRIVLIADQKRIMVLRLPKRNLIGIFAVVHYMILHFPIPLIPIMVNPWVGTSGIEQNTEICLRMRSICSNSGQNSRSRELQLTYAARINLEKRCSSSK